MLKGFKDFIMRGNVIDLAVAVVIGAAFTALVASITNGIILPIVQKVLQSGPSGATRLFGIEFNFAGVLTAIITFLVTAAVVYFVFVMPMNKFREKFGKPNVEQKVSEEVELLREIRNELRARGDASSVGPQDN